MADAVTELSPAFEARLHQLAAVPGMRVEALTAEIAILRAPAGDRRVVLVPWQGGDDAAMAERLHKIVRSRDPLPVEVVLIGGPASAMTLLRKAKPFVTTARRYLYHLPDDGPLWHDRSGPSHTLLAQEPPVVTLEDWEALRASIARGLEESAVQQGELTAFSGRQQAKPVVTYAVLGIIGVMLMMQASFGGIQSDTTVVRLGALSPTLVRAGEWWRLASCTFLHGSVPHVIMNGWVLLVLGSFAERIIGSWRYALLYCVSALAGSVASYYRLDPAGLSVGASGALWGCLGAHAVLAYRSDGLLPEAMIPGARRAALMNLGLNVFVSFMPRVDWAAHFGGGIAGALLTFLVLRRGLPRLRDVDPRGAAPPDRRPPYIVPAALVMGALMLGGLATAVVKGRVWELRDAPSFARQEIPTLGVSLDIPNGLAPTDTKMLETNIGEVGFGDIRSNPVLIGVVRFDGPTGAEGVAAGQAEIIQELRNPDKEATVVQAPVDAEIAGKPAVRARYRYKSGIERWLFFVFGAPGAMHRVEVYVQPDFPAWEQVPDRVAGSMRFER